MTELLTAAQMRQIEQAAIDSGAVTGLELMERAGAGVVEAVFEEWPELASSTGGLYNRSFAKAQGKAVVFCGPGNNGGDGYVIARLLKKRGWNVFVYGYGAPEKLPPDACAACDSWRELGPILSFTDDTARDPVLCDPHPTLWIDAIFGTGLDRPLPERVTRMLHRVYYEQNWCRAPVIAVDLPTGLNADTGAPVQTFFLTADLTVTFHARKFGHVKGDGPLRCGKVVVKDIGL